MTEDEKADAGISRRSALKRIGAAGALAWTTPIISSLRTPAFAQSPGPDPECAGEECLSLVICSSNTNCFCFSSAEGGGFCLNSVECAGLTRCPGGTDDCPEGQVCLVDTCCIEPVCVALSEGDTCREPPGGLRVSVTHQPNGRTTAGV
jgi:hypothetical protein